MDDSVTDAVKRDLDFRTERGIRKYGQPLEESGLSDRQLVQHAYEEALDLAQYLKTLLIKMV